MRQTVPAVAALSLLALLAAACGSSGGGSSSSSSSSPSAATAAFKACVVSDTGTINDKSFNQSAYEGATQAAAASGGKITAQFLPSSSPSDYASNITSFINQKCGIIVTVGFLMGDATAAAAKANPSQKFAIVDFTYAKPFKNVSALAYNTVEDGFQAGYLAAGMSKTKKVATFGGQKLPTVTIYMDGFWDGVQYYNQKHNTNVQVLGWNEKTQNGSFTGNFTDITAGQRLTNTFISEGADVIFPVAGNVGLGAAKAVQNADAAAGTQKVNMMWVDVDGCISTRPVLQVLHHQREQGHHGFGQERGADGRQWHVQGRNLHRHAGQRRRRACSVPRLRQQGPCLAAGRARTDQGRYHQRQDRARQPRAPRNPESGRSTPGRGPAPARVS